MTAYRGLLQPVSDQEAAALAELSRRVTAVRMRVTIPAIVVAAAAGIGAALAHIAGYFTLFGRLPDGSYYVSKGSICVTMLFAILAAAVPATLVVRAAHAMAVKGWKREAKERFQLDAETVEDLAQMFAPVKLRLGSPDGD